MSVAGGPGGEEVGRVSVRAVPDTSNFDNELRRELQKAENSLKVTIPVEFDVDTAGLRTQLEALERSLELHIPVEFDTSKAPTVNVDADIDRAQREVDQFVARTDARQAEIDVDVDLDSLDAAVARASARMRQIIVPVDIDRDRFNSSMAALARGHKVTVEVDVDRNRTLAAFGGVLGGMTSAAQSAFGAISRFATSAFSGANESVSALTGSFGKIGSEIIGVVAGAGKFLAISVGLAEAGAAITAVWGAVSTAVAAVPAAIGLIGAPIAAVMLGMDGIKRAAQQLKPEFDALKASVSATFEAGLIPVFNQLRSSLTAMTGPINAVAQSLVGIAEQTANWVTQAGGLQLIQTAFLNIAEAIKGINLLPLLDGFTRLAGNRAALQALVGVINEVGRAIQEIADNPALDQAFRGLEQVLISLTRAFQNLINNGIRAFSTAAPGIKDALDGITSFFSKFDWERLGAAVGNALKGVGDALKNIPPSTIEALTQAFERLGQVLSGPQVQGAIQAFIDLLPGLITTASDAIAAISEIAVKLKAAFDLLTADSWAEFQDAWNRLWADVPARAQAGVDATKGAVQTLPEAGKAAAEGFINNVLPPLEGLPPRAGAAVTPTAPAVGQGLMTLPQVGAAPAQGLVDGMLGLLTPLPGQAGAAVAPTPQTLAQVLNPMAPLANAEAAKVPPAVSQGLAPLIGAIQGTVGPAPQTLAGILNPMAPQAQAAGGQIVAGFGSGISTMSPTLQSQLGLLPPIANTGWSNVVGTVQPGLAPAAGAVTAGLDPAQQALATSLTGMAAVVPTAFTTPLQTALTTAFTTINSQIPTIFTTPFQTALTTAFTTITSQIPALFTTPFQTALTTAFTTINAQIPTLFTTPFQTALTTAFTTIFAQFPTIFTTPFTTALTTAFSAINAQIPTIFTTPFQTALTTAFTTIFAQFPTTFTTPFTDALTTAIQTVVGQIPSLFEPVNQAFITAFAAIVALVPTDLDVPMNEAVKTAMTNMETAVKDGFTRVTAAVTAGNDAIIAEMDKLPPAGKTAGDNLINAIASAIAAGRSKVVNAIAQVISAAIAQAQSQLQIGSPSKVFWGFGEDSILGYIRGVLARKPELIAMIDKLFSDVVAAWNSFKTTIPDFVGSSTRLSSQVSSDMNIGGGGHQVQPVVNVYVGNEQLDSRTDYRVGLAFSDVRNALAVRTGRH